MYELTYIINPNIAEADVNKLKEEISGFITGNEGILLHQKEERRRLAYIIKKFTTGLYVSLDFDLEPEKLAELEKKLKLESAIIRYLIITKEKLLPAETASSAAPKREKKEKVKIEELDEKLKELLEE